MRSVHWSGVTIDCIDPRRLGDFWSVLLSRERTEALPGWVRLGTHDDALPVICFQPVPEPKQGKTRIHLDIAVDNIEQAAGTVIRLGGRSMEERHDYDEGIVMVMADPEGNEFCLVQYFNMSAR
jgi:predicted enzyme related to lactoylglutathione lyase